MNQHQILTGAVNAGDNCYSVGSVEGVPFTAYTAGCNIVILANNFQRVQIIPGILHGNVQVNCLDCATDVGKIAAAYGKNICIFEPTPILDANAEHKLNYKWIKTAVVQADCYVSVISWNLEGTKLLTGGSCIQLWHLIGTDKNGNTTDLDNENALNGDAGGLSFKWDNNNQVNEEDSSSSQDSLRWACVWQCSTATNVCFLNFSPDGSLFVSAGKTDRLAKIWYRSAANHDYSGQSHIIGSEAMQKRLTSHVNNVNYTFVYIVHPRAITGICWRKTSKYMPKSSVANMLVTSCKDNICRLWVQTLLPEDGLVNFNSIEGLEQNSVPRVHTTRHRQKIMQRLKHMKTFSQFRKRHASKNEENEPNPNANNQPIPNLPNTYSVHDFHCFGIHGATMMPGIHFHLAASINAKSDIPLVPKLEDDLNDANNANEKVQPSFVMHWLNNKEMIFTQQAEKLLQQISKKIFKAETNAAESAANKMSDNDDTDEALSNDDEMMNNNEANDQLNDEMLENETNSSTLNAEAGKKFRHKLCKNVGVSKKLKKKKEIILKQIQENHQQIPQIHPEKTSDPDADPDSYSTSAPHVRSSIHTVSSSHSNVDLLLSNTPAGTTVTSLGDFIDRKFETLLREWHTSYDLLFSIHPVDGSLLVWLVEWLDETCPGSFRQAQVSFSSRIPNAIPLGDAITMSHNVSLYAPQSFLDLRFVIANNGKAYGESMCCEYGCCRADGQGEGNLDNINEQDETKEEPEANANEDDDALYGNDEDRSELEKSKMLLLTPTVCMVTKHNNGSLNLWHIGFAENTNFTQVLSISHKNRVCGHRFRVNDISCHPVLPLLLTTSHHNLPGLNSVTKNSMKNHHLYPGASTDQNPNDAQLQGLPNSGFCSELILWKVDSVGPLSKSGGVTELARINSPNIAAFANVAWIPTLLPSTTLGSISNSPSACFIASDGNQLHVYQSVIDARTLLAEMNSAHRTMSLDSSGSFEENAFNQYNNFAKSNLKDAFKIVSLQSTSRPGCILELDAITDANHDWQNTQLLHVFQDQMICGDVCYARKQNRAGSKEDLNNPSLFEPGLDAVVDLRHSEVFKEPFYLVLLEKNENQQSVLHMWKLVISSQTDDGKLNKYSYVPDSNLVQDSDNESNLGSSSRIGTPDAQHLHHPPHLRKQSKPHTMWKQTHPQSYTPEHEFTPLKIKTEKVCTQVLPLPDDVEVIHATPAAGHLSSSNIYPACFAPYLLCTACSDGSIRFWKCQMTAKNGQASQPPTDGYEEDDEYEDGDERQETGDYFASRKANKSDSDQFDYNWTEWEFMIGENKSSMIELGGFPLYVSCAYSGRIACAYKEGQSYSKPTSKTPNTRFININLAIYECESTGGSEWNLEDVIHLKNIVIPQTENNNIDFDLGSLIDKTVSNRKTADTLISKITSQEQEQLDRSTNYIQRLLSVPSYTTIQTLKKIITEQGNQFTLTQKSIVQLDWVSTEDGSHVLSVSVGNKISVFTPVSTDIAQANLQAMKASLKTGATTTNRMLLKQASSMVANPNAQDDIRWMCLRTTHLRTVDGLPPLPMQMSWVRDGILVVGCDSEMKVYSQWKQKSSDILEESSSPTLLNTSNMVDSRMLTEHGLLSHAQESSSLRLPTHSNMPRSSSNSNLSSSLASKETTSVGNMDPHKNKQQPSTASASTQSKASVDLSALSQLPDFGIFEASRLACPVLPQYHPKQLMELLAFGKIQRVKAILNHLVISLCTTDPSKVIGQGKFSGSQKNLSSWTRTRTLSIAGGPPPMSPNFNNSLDFEANIPAIPEEVQLDYNEITSVRPLPLFTLIQAEIENPQQKNEKSGKDGDAADGNDYDSLFSMNQKSQIDETLDEILGKSSFNFNQMQKKPEKISLTDFGGKQARLLTKLLTHSHLPGLSSLDQMHLLALADAVASFNSKSEKEDANNYAPEEKQTISPDSLDDCGLRFILTMRQHIYLLCCLPMAQRKQLQIQGLQSCNLVWAFHSETQDEIIQLIPCMQKQAPRWAELKEVGVGWWIRSNFVLKRLIEQLAKANFSSKQDPLDAALFYLAMKKKSLVWGLYRSIGDKRMTEFFQNNFAEDKWRKAALKNAFVLLGKQRFEHAAAFFLLAGSIWDAIEVCINKLDDLQLAMVIIRMYEGDVETVPETLKKVLYQEVLGCAQDGTQYDPSKAHPDPFYRSMAFWMLQEYSASLNTLLETDIGHSHVKYNPNDTDKEINISPSVFNFYLYLRNQPLIVRRQLAQTIKQDGKLVKGLLQENVLSDAITPFERRLYFITAHQHFRAGCPSLALEVLSRLPNRILLDDQSISKDTPRSSISSVIRPGTTADKKQPKEEASPSKAEDFDWGAPVASQEPKKEEKADDLFDWGAPVSLQTKEDSQFKIDIQISSSSSESDDDDKQSVKKAEDPSSQKRESMDRTSANNEEVADKSADKKETKLDIMAQQLRFIACLKILMEELSTLATGFEVDGGQLRYHLYVWLEKSVLALKIICNYRTFSMRSQGMELFKNQAMILDDSDLTPAEKSPKNFDSTGFSDYKAPTLHEILIADKLDFEEKLQRAARRKQWLQSNESLLRTLLSYCSLHGAHGGGLAAVRMELILLLQELQQERTSSQLFSPIPFPTTLPLLAASVACQKTVIADPIKHLHAMTHDILETVLELRAIPLSLPANYCEIFMLRDLGISLSACVYQSLCDSDSFSVKMAAKENKQSKMSANLLTSNHATVKRQLTNASDSSNYSFKSGVGKTPSSSQLNSNNLSGSSPNPADQPISEPIKWPGVQSLRALLARDKDEDSPKLHTLLCEAYCAVYLSQLLFALAACDSHILFRLVTLPFETNNWSALFGGGIKRLLNVVKSRVDSVAGGHLQTPGHAQQQASGQQTGQSAYQTQSSYSQMNYQMAQQQQSSNPSQPFFSSQQSASFDEQQASPTMNLLSAIQTLHKQRRNFHMKILQQLNQDKDTTAKNAPMSEDKPTYREQFVAPQMSVLSFLMTKPQMPDELIQIDYDSSESVQSEEDYDAQFDLSDNLYEENLFTLNQPKDLAVNQSTYDQFAWGIMRLAVLKLCRQHLDQFLLVAGLEMQDLPTISPLIHAMFKVIDIWIDYLCDYMDFFPGAPLSHFLPNSYVEPAQPGGPSIFKYKALLELNNTPFRHHNGITKPMKRLWNYLVRQELVQPIFIRYIWGQRKTINGVNQYVPPTDANVETDYADKEDNANQDPQHANLMPRLDPTRIVHKDQDLISAFCVNHANAGLIALSTPKEIQELDMSVLLGPVPWLEEEAEYDILNLLRGPESLPSTNYLVVQHPSDRLQMSPANIAMQNSTPQLSMTSYSSIGQTSRSTIMLKSHKLEGTKRMCSHPTLPLYLSGSQDGSVKLWEWNHQQELSTPQPPGKFGKVTRVLFNQLGNKFGICDADGHLSLWQVSLNTNKPFYSVKAHSKQCSDFTFLGCSSVVVTAGESVDHRNIALWDTLLKPRKSRVSTFSCLESHGASAILYCPINQVLLAGGRRGELCVIEVRQRKERAKWQAHETTIKCMALEPGEAYFATGSSEGDVKVWSLGPVSVLLFSFPGEHSRNTLFRNLGMGVSHLYIDAYGRLFSCGADGSLKVRLLNPDRNTNIVCSL